MDGRHRGGGVAVDQHAVGLGLVEQAGQAGQDGGGDVGQGLAGLHDGEVVVGHDPEQVQHLIQHGAVLAGDADEVFNAGSAVERADDRGHLDRFGPGTDDRQYFPHPS